MTEPPRVGRSRRTEGREEGLGGPILPIFEYLGEITDDIGRFYERRIVGERVVLPFNLDSQGHVEACL
jgi:hypothetical protein